MTAVVPCIERGIYYYQDGGSRLASYSLHSAGQGAHAGSDCSRVRTIPHIGKKTPSQDYLQEKSLLSCCHIIVRTIFEKPRWLASNYESLVKSVKESS